MSGLDTTGHRKRRPATSRPAAKLSNSTAISGRTSRRTDSFFPRQSLPRGDPFIQGVDMSALQILPLLLALSVALHIGCAAASASRHAGTPSATALLVGAGAAGTACALYLSAVSAYH